MMGSPYTSVTVSGYNANPPADDGTTVPTNEVDWATIKTKLGDPLNTAVAAVNTNAVTAFGKTIDGSGVVSTALDYPAGATDQGKLIKFTASGKTFTTPDATSVGSPFLIEVSNISSGSTTLAGFGGTQTIDGLTTQTLLAGTGCFLRTDGANWFSSGLAQPSIPKPQGRLTLTSLTPVLAADVISATVVYYTPYEGNLCPINNGTIFTLQSFAELTLTLVANHLANTLYDVFGFLNAGVPTIGTGPGWSVSTAGSGARGVGAGTTELQRVNGLYTNKNSMTARNGATTYTVAANQGTYLGSIFIDAVAGQVTCHVGYGQSRKWGVWNAFNRQPTYLLSGDGTASWLYGTATFRPSNNNSANSLTTLCGLPEEMISLFFEQFTSKTNAGSTSSSIGIGVNSTTVASGTIGQSNDTSINPGSTQNTIIAKLLAAPALGINTYNCLERGGNSNTTFSGTEANMRMEAIWRS